MDGGKLIGNSHCLKSGFHFRAFFRQKRFNRTNGKRGGKGLVQFHNGNFWFLVFVGRWFVSAPSFPLTRWPGERREGNLVRINCCARVRRQRRGECGVLSDKFTAPENVPDGTEIVREGFNDRIRRGFHGEQYLIFADLCFYAR